MSSWTWRTWPGFLQELAAEMALMARWGEMCSQAREYMGVHAQTHLYTCMGTGTRTHMKGGKQPRPRQVTRS